VLRLLVSVAVFAAVWLPGPAGAGVALTPCGKTPGLLCGEVAVPLDRGGETPETVTLHVEELPSSTSQRGVMFLLAGGPGQGSANAFELGSPQSALFLRLLFPDYTLVAFDGRGTGASGALRCPGLQQATTATVDQETALASTCASALGPNRRFYSTADHVADLEAVRQSLGLGRIGLYGVSYGTKLALAYAAAFPATVERLLLDSVLPVDGPDPLNATVARELPATLAAFCAGGACPGATASFANEVVQLANRFQAKPAQAKVLQASGGSRTLRLSGEDLLSTVVEADLNPGLAAELPAAVHAASRGDVRPLVRLWQITGRASVEPAAELSVGLYAATTCDDGLFPWPREAPVAAHAQLLDAAVASLPAGSFGPFGRWVARTGVARLCLGWPPPAGGVPLPAGPLPDVPVLAVSGGFDLRTPTASAVAVASQFPQGRVLVVPGVGHSVLSSDVSGCSQLAVRSWAVAGTAPSSCARVAPLVPVLATPPAVPARPSPAATARLAGATVREALAAWVQVALRSKPFPVAGLYSGKLVPGERSFTLTRYALAPGIELSGKLQVAETTAPWAVTGTVRVGGRAAVAGTLQVAASQVTGTLGGRGVRG
jgi:pimeloyl-ACP methyl ester carboxylesterase